MADVTLSQATKDAIGVATVNALDSVDNVFRAPSWRQNQADVYWNYEAVFTTVYEKIVANQNAIMLDQALIKTQLATILSAIGVE